MKLKINLDFTVDLGENFPLAPLDEIKRNFETDEELIDVLGCGNPINDLKVAITKVE